MKNPLIEKFERHLDLFCGTTPESVWIREAIAEILRLEGLLLEERMKCEAYEIEFKKRCNPVPGKQKANAKRLKDLFKAMKI